MVAIDNFFKSFEEMVASATNLADGRHTVTFKKLIFSSILDALSKTVSSEKFGNYERFSKFIIRFCEWPHHSKVSIPHLVRFLKLIPCPEFEQLRMTSLEKIDEWEQGKTIYLDSDFDLRIAMRMWPRDQKLKKPLGDISIESFTHIALLWKYRNSLVHEMRRLGFSMDSIDEKEPCYLSTREGDKEEHIDIWALNYPLQFFETISKNGIKNLKDYFNNNKLNPFDSYDFGSYWIEGLNE